MSLKSDFGNKVKELRESLMLSQEALAEKLGIHRNTLARIENGKNFVSCETLEAMSTALGVDYEEFFKFNKPTKKDPLKAFTLKFSELDDKDAQFFLTILDAYLKAKKK